MTITFPDADEITIAIGNSDLVWGGDDYDLGVIVNYDEDNSQTITFTDDDYTTRYK